MDSNDKQAWKQKIHGINDIDDASGYLECLRRNNVEDLENGYYKNEVIEECFEDNKGMAAWQISVIVLAVVLGLVVLIILVVYGVRKFWKKTAVQKDRNRQKENSTDSLINKRKEPAYEYFLESPKVSFEDKNRPEKKLEPIIKPYVKPVSPLLMDEPANKYEADQNLADFV